MKINKQKIVSVLLCLVLLVGGMSTYTLQGYASDSVSKTTDSAIDERFDEVHPNEPDDEITEADGFDTNEQSESLDSSTVEKNVSKAQKGNITVLEITSSGIDNAIDFKTALADTGISEISLKPNSTIVLDEALIIPNRDLSIKGNNSKLTLNDNYNGRHMRLNGQPSNNFKTQIEDVEFKGHNDNNLKKDFSSIKIGGGIYFYGYRFSSHTVTLEVDGCRFTGCASSNGGAVEAQGATVNLNNVGMNGNVATGTSGSSRPNGGGSIWSNSANINVTDCVFTDNSADFGGGAINAGGSFNNKPEGLIITGSKFESNFASRREGGAICVSQNGSNLSMENTDFIKNESGDYGGAVGRFATYSNQTDKYVDCDFIDNKSGNDGGAVSLTGSNRTKKLTLIDCTFKNNTATGQPESGYQYWYNAGGGVFSCSEENVVQKCTFQGNSARWGGGFATGVAGSGNWVDILNISESVFKNNTADIDGGAIRLVTGIVGLNYVEQLNVDENTTFSANKAKKGYLITSLNDKTLHEARIKTMPKSFSSGFEHAYNNYDINYTSGTLVNFTDIIFDLDGGKINGNDIVSPQSISNLNKKIINPGTPEREGYTFDGWIAYRSNETIEPNQTGSRWNFDNDEVGSENLKLVAQWKMKTYKVVFFKNDSSGNKHSEVTVAHGDKASKPEALSRKGYIFDGWYTTKVIPSSPVQGTKWSFNTPITTDTAIYAGWKTYSYKVTFNGNSADKQAYPQYKTVKSPEDTIKTLPSEPRKKGHTFKGWYTDKGGQGNIFTSNTLIDKDMIVFAKWSKNKYSLSFDINKGDGPTPKAQSIPYGEKAKSVTKPTRKGYDFLNWNTEKDGSGTTWKFDTTTMPDHDISLYAQWKVNDNSGENNKGDVDDNKPKPSNPPPIASVKKQKEGSTHTVYESNNRTDKEKDDNTIDSPGNDADKNQVHENDFYTENKTDTSIQEGRTPLYVSCTNAHWSLINLLACVIGAVLSISMLIIVFRRRHDEIGESSEYINNSVYKNAKLWLLISVVASILNLIVFIITQDMSAPMAFTDTWTIINLLLLTLGITGAVKIKKKQDLEDEDMTFE